MAEFVFKLPDLGEGAVHAEIVEWRVQLGQTVTEGDVIVDVMTDKANVEIPAPVGGTVVRTSGEAGDRIAVGAELAAFAVSGEMAAPTASGAAPAVSPEGGEAARDPAGRASAGVSPGGKVAASPAVRRRAREMGVDLAAVAGSGPRGRVLERDFEAFVTHGVGAADGRAAAETGGGAEGQPVIGVRRRIAERMVQSKREIPHFSYVEEVDVTELEALRRFLNGRASAPVRLTLLPLVAFALVRALRAHPACNARYDAERGLLLQSAPVHLGIATHTPEGLLVPVVRDADSLDLWHLADAAGRAAAAARDKRRNRADLIGSTITITSLGRLGGLAATPIINYPEVAIVGVNKAVRRPVAMDGGIAVRTVMNLSSSFDHRFVDGFDAATFVQEVRALLEHPGAMFAGVA